MLQDGELATGNHYVDALRQLADSENAGCVIVSAQATPASTASVLLYLLLPLLVLCRNRM